MTLTNFDISFSFNPLFFFIGIGVIILYTYLIYKITLPPVSKLFKATLIFLRTAALILILLLIFEPVISLNYQKENQPKNLVFVDNSLSMFQTDSAQTKNSLNNLLENLANSLPSSTEFYSFGKDVSPITNDSLEYLSFDEQTTDFSNIFNYLGKLEYSPRSVTIISDGILNRGNSPINEAEKLGAPIITVGLGNTTEQQDMSVNKILYNNYIYKDKNSLIRTEISNKGLANNNTKVSLYENQTLITSKNITLSESGINTVDFDYLPTESGEKKITVRVNSLDEETTKNNNSKAVYINVLDTKLKVLIVGGAPSKDLSIIKQTLEQDDNIEVKRLIQVSNTKFINDGNDQNQLIEEADILFLIGFPSKSSSTEIINKIRSSIADDGRPFFMLKNADIDNIKLKLFADVLPYKAGANSEGYDLIQPLVSQPLNPIIKNGIDNPTLWENLPPVFMHQSRTNVKANAEVLLKAKIKNIPTDFALLTNFRQGNVQCISVNASDIWKWKLQSDKNSTNLFDVFIQNCVKWLNTTDSQKPVTVKPVKRIFQNGESIDFTAQIYDETYTAVDNAEVVVTLSLNDKSFETVLNSVTNGIYEGSFDALPPGDYTYKASAKVDDFTLGKDEGRFSIQPVNLEQLNIKADTEFLKLLSSLSNGKYFYLDQQNQILKLFENDYYTKTDTETVNDSIDIWANEFPLFIIVLLFALEWFFRKRAGML